MKKSPKQQLLDAGYRLITQSRGDTWGWRKIGKAQLHAEHLGPRVDRPAFWRVSIDLPVDEDRFQVEIDRPSLHRAQADALRALQNRMRRKAQALVKAANKLDPTPKVFTASVPLWKETAEVFWRPGPPE